MGQYWYPVNLDKKEFVHPHQLGAGLKLWEQLANHPGTGAALIVLCAAMPEARGGGDLDPVGQTGNYAAVATRTIGRWAGDRIALVGDYAENEDLAPEHEAGGIYRRCGDGEYTDITSDVCTVIEHELDGRYTGEGWKHWERAAH